jgi:hypothetical protein
MKYGIHRFALAAALLAVVPAAQAQFSDLLRSLSGAVRSSGGGTQPPQQQGATPTIGVRGIDEGGTVAQAPASADNTLLDGWTATRSEAARAAQAKGLAARKVAFKSSGN